MNEETVLEWNNDHHILKVILNKTVFVIDDVVCPNNESSGTCYNESISGCLVKWFVTRYGFDCNVGVANASHEIEIAWTLVSESLYDPELWQVWIIPTSDEVFSAWLSTQNGDSSS